MGESEQVRQPAEQLIRNHHIQMVSTECNSIFWA